MATASKLEDYWRQHNIESLFKDLTHLLVQRLPVDPAVAIVQHLQRRYSSSFKTSIDSNHDVGIVSQAMANQLQLRSVNSQRSDTNSISRVHRRQSNQSQTKEIATIPTSSSAFTKLLTNEVSRHFDTNIINDTRKSSMFDLLLGE
jgi:hypothetical protein